MCFRSRLIGISDIMYGIIYALGVLAVVLQSTSAYKNVIFMHGILAGKKEVAQFEMFLDKVR